MKGLKKCASDKFDILVTLDADTKKCKPKEISRLVNELNEYKNEDMITATYKHEKGHSLHHTQSSFSGFRAINLEALKCLYNPCHQKYLFWKKSFKYKEPKEGYRLERILGYIIPLNKRHAIRLKAILRDHGKGNFNVDEVHEGVDSYKN